jgi:polysulfide reductase-like protein
VRRFDHQTGRRRAGRQALARWRGSLEKAAVPPTVEPEQEAPETTERREREWVADHDTATRDMTPAVGKRGGPASWRRAVEDAAVALTRRDFGDARWSFLFKRHDTVYANTEPAPGQVAEANRRMRSAPVAEIEGPFLKQPVWTWEVPLYFWVGGVAAGSSFVALACDVAGDERSAKVARKVSLTAVGLAPPLLIADLGRPERFLNMLRVFKPRSPMNLGAWCLVSFSGVMAGAVGADLLRLPRTARSLGLLASVLGGYLGSYAGVLLASTAVPLWARSRLLLGPIFVATATATGAAATRLTLVAKGLPKGHPTRNALGTLETASILTELGLSTLNQRRLGQGAEVTRHGRPGLLFRAAKTAVLLGLSTRLAGRRAGPWAHDAASVLYLAGGLAFRLAWVSAGKASAAHHEAAAAMGRGQLTLEDSVERARGPRMVSATRPPLAASGLRRAWGEGVRRVSLFAEKVVRRGES